MLRPRPKKRQRLGPKRRITLALNVVEQDVRELAQRGGPYARGLSAEGYVGGYADALRDVQLLLNGGIPKRRHFWETPGERIIIEET